jgi:hypothetical protein
MGDQPVETLPAHRADQSFTVRVGLRRSHRRLQHVPPHGRNRSVHRSGIDAVSIVQDEPVGRHGKTADRDDLAQEAAHGGRPRTAAVWHGASIPRGGFGHSASRTQHPPNPNRLPDAIFAEHRLRVHDILGPDGRRPQSSVSCRRVCRRHVAHSLALATIQDGPRRHGRAALAAVEAAIGETVGSLKRGRHMGRRSLPTQLPP